MDLFTVWPLGDVFVFFKGVKQEKEFWLGKTEGHATMEPGPLQVRLQCMKNQNISFNNQTNAEIEGRGFADEMEGKKGNC